MSRRQTEQLHRLLLLLLLPPLGLFALYLAVRDRSWRSLSNRFACALRPEADDNKPVWIHCASVGETNTAMPLIKLWLRAHPQHRIVVTTTTASAARLLERHALPRVCHYYLPLDYPGFHKRFIRAIRPRCLLVLETEIWLGMFSQCHRHGVAVIILTRAIATHPQAQAWLGSYFSRQSGSRWRGCTVQGAISRRETTRKLNRQPIRAAAEKLRTIRNHDSTPLLTSGKPQAAPLRRDISSGPQTLRPARKRGAVKTSSASGPPARYLVIAPIPKRGSSAAQRKLKKRRARRKSNDRKVPTSDTQI